VLRANTVGTEAAASEGVDVEEAIESTTMAAPEPKGAWQWDDSYGWWWDPEAPAEAEQWPQLTDDANAEVPVEGSDEPALTFDEFMARKLERERQARLVVLEKKVRRHGESVIREWLHLAPVWTRHLLEQHTELETSEPYGEEPIYYWCVS
jgi:hypothetical protein